jgi:hypothetical protein
MRTRDSREVRRLKAPGLRFPISALRTPHSALPLLFWLAAAVPVTLLALRFGMRLLGVRYDTPLPGAVYTLTDPIVRPFYRWFPAPERFDYYAVEWASVAAAGVVTAAALAVYVIGLLVATQVRRKGTPA